MHTHRARSGRAGHAARGAAAQANAGGVDMPRAARWMQGVRRTRPEVSEDMGRANSDMLAPLRALKRVELRAAARSAPAEPTAKRAQDISGGYAL